MNNIKIADAFANGKAFIPFITCGDPNLETTKEVVHAAVEAGANLIELGIPFSDPTAEGVTIQAANERALAGGVTTDKIFTMVEEIREKVTIPMVFMTYANVLYSYGLERFAKRCQEIGIQGVILPDVPFEEKEEFDSVLFQYDVDLSFSYCSNIRRQNYRDCKGCKGIHLPCIITWCYRCKKQDYNRHRCYL